MAAHEKVIASISVNRSCPFPGEGCKTRHPALTHIKNTTAQAYRGVAVPDTKIRQNLKNKEAWDKARESPNSNGLGRTLHPFFDTGSQSMVRCTISVGERRKAACGRARRNVPP